MEVSRFFSLETTLLVILLGFSVGNIILGNLAGFLEALIVSYLLGRIVISKQSSK